MSKFASLRLGKTSVEDIRNLVQLSPGIRKDDVIISVKCTQVPQEFEVGTYVFIWLGSDNNKGIPTEWKQGYQAIGKLQHINRGEKFNDESTSDISIEYIFENTFNRLDILSAAPKAYYLCSALPVIGLDDHSNQTIRLFNEAEERCDIKAFFSILSTLNSSFQNDALRIDDSWEEYLGWKPSGEIIEYNQELENKVRDSFLRYWRIIDQHGAQFELYVNKFESVVNPILQNLELGLSDVFAIVDFEQYNAIINRIIATEPSLSYLNDEKGPDGSRYYIWSTNRHFRNYLEIISMSDFFGNVRQQHNRVLSVASATSDFNKDYLRAMRTKPFLLLAGISGTGKSRIVKQMAFDSCPDNGVLRSDLTSPGNYCLIEVKPNWHDSTELIGYESQIGGAHYQLTPFVKFLAKAMIYPTVPFFVCLDEMNLAPVEQYFAEFLSVLESRTKIDGHIVSEPLITSDVFSNKDYELKLQDDLFGLELKEEITADGKQRIISGKLSDEAQPIYDELKKHGLRIPENVIVIGTVNMDETTHQFSRKVIDRAMTIEMNLPEGDPFMDFFNNASELEYRANPTSPSLYLATETKASDVVKALAAEDAEKTEWLKGEVAAVLTKLNTALEDTPFKVAYRVQNELMLYFYQIWLDEDKPANWEDLLTTATDQILMMKVLPRVEGDEDLLEKPLACLADFCVNYNNAKKKVEEMQKRLEHSHFTSYWP